MTATYLRDGAWQIGDYVIEQYEEGGTWAVRMAGTVDEDISTHPTRHAAELAVERYQAGDKRRRRA